MAADKFPKRQGGVAFASPKFDVPLKNARWELLLPPDYEYTDFAGTMGRDVSGAPVVTVNYSAAEYSKQEAKNRDTSESGRVAVLAKPPLQVSEKAASTEMMRIDARELPEWAAAYASGAKGEQVVLARRSPCSCRRRREESHLFLRDQLEARHVVSYRVIAGTADRRTCSAPLARAA